MQNIISPDWPAPTNVVGFTTTRQFGVSEGCYQAFNLAHHVGDDSQAVDANRQLLREQLPSDPCWLDQVHTDIVMPAEIWQSPPKADASFTHQTNRVCIVMTADCLPVLICDKAGKSVAAVHAGWRSLVKGIIPKTIKAMQTAPADLLVWFGPSICQDCFEVGPEVFEQFVAAEACHAQAFKPSSRDNHYLADLTQIARQQCERLGITATYGGEYCTYERDELFYSYRRDGQTGRLASLIWIAD